MARRCDFSADAFSLRALIKSRSKAERWEATMLTVEECRIKFRLKSMRAEVMRKNRLESGKWKREFEKSRKVSKLWISKTSTKKKKEME